MVFVDSNIWLYALLPHQDVKKTSSARTLIKTRQSEICVSSQVIIEVAANLLRKGNFLESQITKFIEDTYQKYKVVIITEPILLNASELRTKYSLSYFDSMIVSAALESKSSILYSEDMHNGLIVEGKLTIINPLVQVQ